MLSKGQFFQVIRVEAADEDCSPHFGDICGYAIESQGQPFSISKEGNVFLCGYDCITDCEKHL